ncbi:ATP-binding protein [Desulfonatronovibrio hydrogenovorans]|uniref:ATP-binding protein n=1 Tax=Desulfonatronovibrio hydrogenovorans TaxID=53245 RepID=UPI0005539CC7|nr:ATP-binding protein [Desulfonatronovibrio hydrogenovorans]
MFRFQDISLKNKIFFSTLAMVLMLSIAIAIFARWILVSSLVNELTIRGIAIAQSIADQGRGYVLTRDHPNLVSLVFDASQLGERQILVDYIFIIDDEKKLLSHTFIKPFPEELIHSNPIPGDRNYSVRKLQVADSSAYDIAVPIWEGIYQIGTVRVGLKEKHIHQIIHKLRITFLGFIFGTIIIIFLLSHWLAKYITKSLSQLTKMADEISQGNLDFKPLALFKDSHDNREEHCPAYYNTDLPCWHVDKVMDVSSDSEHIPEKASYCTDCMAKRKKVGDEVQQLADSFKNMVRSIKLYRSRVRESESKYRSLFKSGPAPIFVLSCGTLIILDANPSAQQTYGYTREELVNMPFTKLAPEFKNKFISYFEAYPEDESFVYAKAIHYKKGQIPFYTNVEACRTRYRNKDAVIVATTDITEMIDKDAQLIQASKMTSLGQLSAGIAHELNQPLNAIKMGSEFLSMMHENKEDISSEQMERITREISRQVDRATEIINNLREFGRKSDFTKEKTDINKPVHNVLSITAQQLKLQNITVKLNLTNDLPPIMAHKNRLEQVIFNLITNARDAIIQKQSDDPGAGSGEIVISTSLEDDQVVLAVSDNGTGMPESVREKIFDPFYTTKQTGMGMGLGLSISYGIIKDYEGEIDIHSVEGSGTTFKISFPRLKKIPVLVPG